MKLDLDAAIAAAKKHVVEVRTVDQDVLLGDEIVTMRLSSVDGPTWINLTGRHPARADVARDVQLGYDLPSVLRAYHPHVAIVEGDEVDNLQRFDADGKPYSRWPEIHDALDPEGLKNLSFALWGLNDYEHQQRMVEAGKASAGQRSKKKRR